MNRFLALAAVALIPGLASAQTVVTDPNLEATAAQQLAAAKDALVVAKQQLATLNTIQALLQAQLSRPTFSAALAYAARQGEAQATERAQIAAAGPQP